LKSEQAELLRCISVAELDSCECSRERGGMCRGM
jgi:hypothetical protein